MGKVFDSEPGAVTVPNPDLRAEYAYNIDMGLAKVFRKVLKVDLSAYYTLLKDALVRRDYTLGGEDSIFYDGTLSKVQAIQNAAVTRVYGFQCGVNWELAKGFNFSSDFNWQLGEEELDNGNISRSRHAAPWFGVSRFIYHVDGLSLQLFSQYSGGLSFDQLPEGEKSKSHIYASDSDGNPYSPAWYTLNFKAMYRFAERFTMSTGLENITDRRYRTYSSGIASPGRNFILSLKCQL